MFEPGRRTSRPRWHSPVDRTRAARQVSKLPRPMARTTTSRASLRVPARVSRPQTHRTKWA